MATKDKNVSTVLDESAHERELSMKAAFSEPVSAPEPGEELKFHNIAQNHFTKLAKAFQSGHGGEIGRLISAEEMFNYAERACSLEFESDRHRALFIKGFKKGVLNSLSQSAGLMSYDDVDVVRIEIVKDNEFIAYTKLWDDEYEVYSKMRWWLLKDKRNNWVIYDYEDFDSNIRVSTMLGTLIPAPGKKREFWTKDFMKIVRQFQERDADDLIGAFIDLEEPVLKFLEYQGLPTEIESYTRILLISSLVTQEKYQAALDQVEVLESIKSDLPVLAYNKGVCLAGLERWDDAIASYAEYSKVLGWDSGLHEDVADAYYGKGDLENTAEHARKGLQDNPNATGCLASLAAALPQSEFDQVIKYISKSKDPELSYEVVMDYLIMIEKTEETKWFLEKFRQEFPKSELIEYYEEELEPSAEQPEE
ncbi:tetratricopeptide repeat protein [Oceaniferula spumae]